MKKALRIIGIVAIISIILAAIITSMNTKPSNAEKVWDQAMTVGNLDAKNYFIVYSDLVCPYCVAFETPSSKTKTNSRSTSKKTTSSSKYVFPTFSMNMANPDQTTLAIRLLPHIVQKTKANSGITTTKPSLPFGTISSKMQENPHFHKWQNMAKNTGQKSAKKLV